jgi:hypothetical protein
MTIHTYGKPSPPTIEEARKILDESLRRDAEIAEQAAREAEDLRRRRETELKIEAEKAATEGRLQARKDDAESISGYMLSRVDTKQRFPRLYSGGIYSVFITDAEPVVFFAMSGRHVGMSFHPPLGSAISRTALMTAACAGRTVEFMQSALDEAFETAVLACIKPGESIVFASALPSASVSTADCISTPPESGIFNARPAVTHACVETVHPDFITAANPFKRDVK